MRKKGIVFLFLVVVIVAGFLLLRPKSGEKKPETTPTTAEQPAVVQERPSIEAFGLVKPTELININIDFPARVRRLYVQEGEKVALGQPLLALDVEEYRTEIRNTEYELLMARFELKKTESEITQLTAEIAKKEEQLIKKTDYELVQIHSDLSKAQQELETKQELLKVNAIPAHEVTEAEKAVSDLIRSFDHLYHEKAEEIRKLKAELALKQKNNGRPGSELASIDMQKERITLLEEKLSMLQKKLEQNFIRNDEVISNIENGVVTGIGYNEGDLLTVERKVLSIIDLDSLMIKANIAEEFIKDVRPGAEAVITPVADYTRTYQGKIIRRADLAILENGETVIPVEISIENRDDFLLPNFNVDVKIYID